MTAAASMPGYVSPVEKLNQHLAELSPDVVQEYCTKCESVLKSKSFTVEQLQSMYVNSILPMLNGTATATDFIGKLLEFVNHLS